jgi:hypothetical protein
VLRHAIVQIGAVRCQQLDDRAMLQQHAADERLRLRHEILPRFVPEVHEDLIVGLEPVEPVEPEPLHREIRHQAGRFRVGEHARHLGVEDDGCAQLTRRG